MFKFKNLAIRAIMLSSAFLSLIIMLPYINISLSSPVPIKDFSQHIMSWATLNNVDIASRIKDYYQTIFVTVFIFFGLSILLYLLFRKYKDQSENAPMFIFIQSCSLIGFFAILGNILAFSLDGALYFLGGIIVLAWIALGISKEHKNQPFILILYFCLGVPFALYFWRICKSINILTNFISFEKITYDVTIFLILWFVITFIFIALHKKVVAIVETFTGKKEEVYLYSLSLAAIPVLSTIVFQSIALESYNILNKRFDVVLHSPVALYSFIMVSSLIMASIIFWKKLYKSSNRDVQIVNSQTQYVVYTWFLPIVLLSFVMISIQPAKFASVGNEFFELANHGLSVDHLFKYGSIPIIETFDAHMLAYQIFAYIYSLLNGYEPWATFLYNSYIEIFNILILYCVLRIMVKEIYAFLLIISFPLLASLFNSDFLLAAWLVLVIIRGVLRYSKSLRQTKWQFLEFWIVASLICLYRLDLGATSLFAGICSYISFLIFSYRFKDIFKFLITGILYGISGLIVFILLCISKNISPFRRLSEFLEIANSNQSWAFPEVGNPLSLAYTIGYYIFPLVSLGILIFIIMNYCFDKKKFNEIESQHKTLIILTFYFLSFVLFNIPRGIVRHSLLEGTLISLLSVLSLGLLSFIMLIYKGKQRLLVFLSSSFVILVLININLGAKGEDLADKKPKTFASNSIIQYALNSPSYNQQYESGRSFKYTRLQGEYPKDAQNLKTVLDVILDKNQTYFDFSSTNYFYALVDRKNPVYMNQSPLIINNDKMQRDVIETLKEQKIPVVLMPIYGKSGSKMDILTVDYKYYLLAEYIYNRYSPMLRLNGFDVYVLKENKKAFLDKLLSENIIQPENYSSDFSYLKNDKKSNGLNMHFSENGTLEIKTTGRDPYIYGFWPNNKFKNNHPSKNNNSVNININYSSVASGSVQLFYTFSKSESFNEKYSQKIHIDANSQGVLNFQLPNIPADLRLDIDMPSITLEKFNIDYNTQGITLNDGQNELWERILGYIPLLWGNQDGNSVYQQIHSLPSILETKEIFWSTQSIKSLEQPVEIVFDIDSDIEQLAYLSLLDKNNKVIGTFSFNVLSGKHLYVVRLSTDYKFWNGKVNKIKFNTDSNVKLDKLSYFFPNSTQFISVK
ncbi:hypothetical protein PO903_02435 [Paenibacillus sp. PK4536]|uniref:hypothetical protein n=1 Tax=Paenibacillus sp. PK4536 TaxID=3024576 RepID=UPI00235A4011|nr:hypothetical protein [Paenibacillus sp. PK4536]WIM39761.1 hypothetical protein PO903_02435 [Paenibacillus sp. PK4536]